MYVLTFTIQNSSWEKLAWWWEPRMTMKMKSILFRRLSEKALLPWSSYYLEYRSPLQPTSSFARYITITVISRDQYPTTLQQNRKTRRPYVSCTWSIPAWNIQQYQCMERSIPILLEKIQFNSTNNTNSKYQLNFALTSPPTMPSIKYHRSKQTTMVETGNVEPLSTPIQSDTH